MIGTVIDNQYRVETLISRNKLLDTYAIQDQINHRKLILLSLRTEAAADPGISQDFHHKAETLLQINHPNLADGIGRGIHEKRPYLIFEGGQGTSLRDHLARLNAGMSFTEIIKTIRNVLSGLQVLHSKGLVHSAVNSANIFLQQGSEAILTGYQLQSNSTDEVEGGTIEVIPPEFIRGRAPEAESDIYGVGVILFEMFSGGQKPFDGNQAPISGTTIQRVRWEQMNKDPDSLRRVNAAVSPGIEEVVVKCLQKEPHKRYHSVSDLQKVLEEEFRKEQGAQPKQEEMETFYDMSFPDDDLAGGEATIVDDSEFIDFDAFSTDTKVSDSPVPEEEFTVVDEDFTVVDELSPIPQFEAYSESPMGGVGAKSRKSRKLFVIIGIIAILLICCVVLPVTIYFVMGDSITLPVMSSIGEQQDVSQDNTQTATIPATATATSTPSITPEPTLTHTHTPTIIPSITPTITPAWHIGDSQIRDADGMEMMYVPAGDFTMGAHETLPDYHDNHSPEHTVYLDAFWMDKYEVTNLQYQQCIDAGGCSGGVTHQTDFYHHHPIGSITWYEAQEFCEWVGGRLPTEAEWEKAARGTDGRYYPWGNTDPDCDQAQFKGCGGTSSEAGKNFEGASEYGIENMVGNVWEWTSDWYAGKYYQSSPSENPTGPEEGNKKILRGGSWNNNPGTFLLAYYRGWNDPNNTYQDYGFRCVVPLNP